MGTLYVVGIPAGNSEDVTLRALRVLREVKLVAAVDVSCAQEFLTYHRIDTPIIHYATRYARNNRTSRDVKETAGTDFVLEALDSGDVALFFEMERATVSDSAHRLVRAAVDQGFAVVAVPGPVAAVTALVTSGLPADAYVSLGFLPQRAAERRKWLASLATDRRTLVAFQTSINLLGTLHDVAETLGDRPLALSPMRGESGEGVWRGTVSEAVIHFETTPPCGEWVLVIGGATGEAARWPQDRVQSELARLLADGLSRKAAVRQVAEASGWRPREVYRLAAGKRFRI